MNVFSQNVTPTRDTTKIVLSTDVARAVAVDLIEGDQAKEEVKVLTLEVDTLKAALSTRDSLVILRENQIEDYIKLQTLGSVELQQKTQDIERLNKELRKQMNLKGLFEVTTGVTATLLIVSLLINAF